MRTACVRVGCRMFTGNINTFALSGPKRRRLPEKSKCDYPSHVLFLTALHHELHALVLDTVISAIRNEPSGAQRKRVSRLINAEKSRCKVLKAKRKDIKGGRSRVLSQD